VSHSPPRRRGRKIAGVAAAVAALVLLCFPAGATPEGTIVIRGAESGSTLKLSVEDDRIVVKGYMSARPSPGCRRSDGRHGATCSLAGVGLVEIRMGPSGDFVEILEKLPVPATIYLGDGSDMVIAIGESDTCYPGGARRNGCVLGAGDDVCVTGDRNSDCVGGPGNDFCKHGDGSDGCWGGPGDDTCVMGPGMDGCHGDGGDDRLYGGASPDQLYGGSGDDFCDGGLGIGKSHICETGPRH
jgi:Ca2+-binding RTX toxin-like protein